MPADTLCPPSITFISTRFFFLFSQRVMTLRARRKPGFIFQQILCLLFQFIRHWEKGGGRGRSRIECLIFEAFGVFF